jgi:uncharacterized protein YndB with AHSA1/START domain
MQTSYSATAICFIRASSAHVWDALTDPELVKRYFFGTQVASTWQVGESITFSGEWQEQRYVDKGVILSCLPEQELSYSYYSPLSALPDRAEFYNIITFTLAKAGEGTTVTVRQTNIPSPEAQAHSEQGWHMILAGMKKLLEENTH